MNITIKSIISSSIPYNTTGLTDRTPNSTDKSAISRIPGDFGKISQDKPNFVARVGLATAQKSNTHQKTTAIKARRGFVLS